MDPEAQRLVIEQLVVIGLVVGLFGGLGAITGL